MHLRLDMKGSCSKEEDGMQVLSDLSNEEDGFQVGVKRGKKWKTLVLTGLIGFRSNPTFDRVLNKRVFRNTRIGHLAGSRSNRPVRSEFENIAKIVLLKSQNLDGIGAKSHIINILLNLEDHIETLFRLKA